MKNNFNIINNKSGFIGNYYDKYNTKNIIEKYIINNYFNTILKICKNYSINSFIDVGCGEGKWLYEFSKQGFDCIGTDHSSEVVELAKKNLKNKAINIFKSNIYDEKFSNLINDKINETGIKNIFFLEVLEHLKDPSNIMDKFKKINFKYMVITVPNEPIWRILNCCRLKYLSSFGNTPGHINHFSINKLKSILNKNFRIIDIKLPIPFLILLLKND